MARTGRAQAAADPWAAAVAGLQRNAAQLGDNLQRSVQRMMHAKRVRPQAEQQASQRRPFSASLASVSQAANAAAGAAAIVVAAAAAPPPAAAPATAWSGGSHGSGGGTVSKEEVGRATWTFLHTLAAQYPERPSRRQKTDARNLVRGLPCGLPCCWAAPGGSAAGPAARLV